MELPKMNLSAINNLKDVIGWKDIKIIENNEPIVDLSKYKNPKLLFSKYYFELGLKGTIDKCFLRETVASKLNRITNSLPSGYKLLIFDGWRSVELQTSLYEYLKLLVSKTFCLKSESEIINYLSTFAVPCNNNQKHPSPHLTGGAVDLTILDNNGNELLMGTGFDDLTEKANTDYYEKKIIEAKTLSSEENKYLANRRFLYNLMREEEFSNYKYEWWHYDYGDQFWAIIKNKVAIYSIFEATFAIH